MASDLDFLIVHTNSAKRVYQDLATSDSAIETPIWAGLIHSALASKGFGVGLIDCEVLGLNAEQSAQEIVDARCKLAVFVVYGQQPSASSQNMSGAVEVAGLVKSMDPEVCIVFVGGHVAALPRETLDKHLCIDIVCTNEGVRTLCDLGKADVKKHLPSILGVGFRDDDGNIVINDASAPIAQKELEVWMPGINWDVIDPRSGYRTAGWHSWSNGSVKDPFAAIYTSLGCPYKCSFCMINVINRSSNDQMDASEMNGFRFWSPEFTIQQIDKLVALGVKNIKIADELFVLNPRHFKALCQLIIDRRYDLNIWAYARVDTCKPEYLSILRQAGVKWLGLGIENPNRERRSLIHKEGFTDINIVNLIEVVRSHDINVGGNYIFGLPGDTEQSMRETLQFAIENKTEMVNFYCAMAYPGSPLYREAVEKGLKLPATYEGFSQHAYETQNLPTNALTASQILGFRDYAWNEYHNNPAYEALLHARFGQHAVDQLKMTRQKTLKRQLLEQES